MIWRSGRSCRSATPAPVWRHRVRARSTARRARQPAPQLEPLPPPQLLGPFDPLLLGWRSRSLVLGDRQEVVTVNGIIRPIVLIKGRAAGTWTMRDDRVELRLWEEQSRATTGAVGREASAVEAYLDPR